MSRYPLKAGNALSVLICARIEGALEREVNAAQFAHHELHPMEVLREVARAAYYWSQRMEDHATQVIEMQVRQGEDEELERERAETDGNGEDHRHDDDDGTNGSTS